MGLSPEVFYGDGVLVDFPSPFPGGVGQALVNGVVTSFTQSATKITFASAPAAGATVALYPKAVDAGGTSSFKVLSTAAAPAATVLKTGAGSVTDIGVFNGAAYAVFLKFYDKVGAVVVGTDVPAFVFAVPAGTRFDWTAGNALVFTKGIQMAITKLVADTDATAVAAGDLTGFVDVI